MADTKDDYLKIVEELKAKVPEKAKSLSKMEQTHSNLVTLLQNRVLTIDSEQAVSTPKSTLLMTYLCIYS